jgi:hypothetical protein
MQLQADGLIDGRRQKPVQFLLSTLHPISLHFSYSCVAHSTASVSRVVLASWLLPE